MDITIDERPNATVVALKGRLDFEASESAGATLNGLLKRPEGVHALVIDGSELSYVSSAGLRVFLTLAKEAKAASTPLVVCALHPAAAEVFEISGFAQAKILDIRPTLDEGIAAVTA
jgi:anti-sigma B factor antagonist